MTLSKALIFTAAIAISLPAAAQRSNIRKAKNELKDAASSTGNPGAEILALQKAKAAIDTAVKDEKTKNDPDAWLTQATVYISLQGNSNLSEGHPYLISYAALEKAFSLDPSYKSNADAIPVIVRTAFYSFNDGVNAFNGSKYDSAINCMNRTLDLLGMKEDSRFAAHKDVDTIRAQSKMIAGYSAYYSGKNDKAIELLQDCAQSPYLQKNGANIFLLLSQAYEKAGNKDKELSTIEDGLKKYPNDDNLKNSEMNYYVASGNTNMLIEKLKKSTEEDPNNPQTYFNLGILYDQLANPKTGDAPANQEELSQKAETALNKAIQLNPDDPQMNYQLAAHYYNQAAAVNNVMSKMSANDMTKYNALQKKRDALFSKALPLLEKAKVIYKSKSSSLTGEDLNFYKGALEALANIYTIQNKLDKAKENRDILNSL